MLRKAFLTIVLTAAGIGVIAGLMYWTQTSLPVSSSNEEALFVVAEGEGVKEIAQNLHDAGLIRSTYWFEAYVFFDGSETKFAVGSFFLKPSMDAGDIVEVLTTGQGAPERQITIIEGWTNAEIADYLQNQGIADTSDFISAVSTNDVSTIIPGAAYDFLEEIPTGKSLEGYLFPDTYRIFENANTADIIERMLDNFSVRFTDKMVADAAAGNMSVYNIVTLASIIEKEVRTDQDRKIAAGIFYERLDAGVALQSDATVNYVTGNQALQPTIAETEIDNPYNTYRYAGLPPGPICNPSLSAILAAIYPQKSDYFYFLTKPDGETVFSTTYEQHLENKQRYLQ
ncbi:MAG: endolytic transglycosylase MltG [Patescibacteria group bacterium]